MSDPSGKSGSKPTSVQTLMRNRGSEFGKLLGHARTLDYLDQVLTSILEPALSVDCQVAEFRNHCLVLICSNASTATRLRMISSQLLESFNEEVDLGIQHMEIRIAPFNRPQPEVRKRRALSSAAIQALGRFASDSGDAEIQAIFDKINARRNR
jgi:hypothetical protein